MADHYTARVCSCPKEGGWIKTAGYQHSTTKQLGKAKHSLGCAHLAKVSESKLEQNGATLWFWIWSSVKKTFDSQPLESFVKIFLREKSEYHEPWKSWKRHFVQREESFDINLGVDISTSIISSRFTFLSTIPFHPPSNPSSTILQFHNKGRFQNPFYGIRP